MPPLPPMTRAKMFAMPTARVGAPPVRPNIDDSPMLRASPAISSTVTGYPQLLTSATATSGAAPAMPGGLLMENHTPGLSVPAAINAMTATDDSSNIDP